MNRAARALRQFPTYLRRLSNGLQVLWSRALGRPLPELRFRSGMVWHHGPYDDPALLFREVYVDRLLPSVADAPYGASIVDIGANIGVASLYWAEGRRDLELHCYEPNPQAFATLQTNIEANGIPHAHLYPEAVVRKSGTIDLWIDIPTVHSTTYGDSPFPNGRKVTVHCVTLDEILDRVGTDVWLLKIDTEGAEGDILQGASLDSLRRCRRLLVEWHDNIVPGVSRIVRERLAAAGFEIEKEHLHPWNEGIIHAVRQER